MVDLLPHVRDILAPTGAQIELTYNGITATMPLIVLSEVDNRASVVSDTEELYSAISIQLDIYHYNELNAREIAITAANLMTSAGFKRSYSSPIPEDNLFRYTTRFETTAQEARKLLYSSGS